MLSDAGGTLTSAVEHLWQVERSAPCLSDGAALCFRNRATELETRLEAFSVQYLQGN